MEYFTIKGMIGKVLTSAENVNNEQLHFGFADGSKIVFYHQQEWFESVYIEDICGSLEDMIGGEFVQAEEAIEYKEDGFGDNQWTFYKFATTKSSVTVRWYGTSDGDSSVNVDLVWKND